jgi:hypothetical protein
VRLQWAALVTGSPGDQERGQPAMIGGIAGGPEW